MDTDLGAIAAALAIIFLVAVASEILMETLRGAVAALFGGVFNSPFFAKTSTFKTALASVQDLLPAENEDAALMLARLRQAEAQARAIASDKTAEIETLVAAADSAAASFGITGVKKEVSNALPGILASVDVQERRRAVFIKICAAAIGVGLCTSAELNAFAPLIEAKSGDWGQVLTGIAAAGGSTFWHEQIERVRGIRTTVQAARDVVALPKKAEITLSRPGAPLSGSSAAG
ncbi:hypothetical protein [Roseivivax sediminis]|uniref:Uncharacterized protein n=1 Tax=Roseivivax sediminis TaxID=936889 RepID=A0A1I2BZR2_9RHOB|nr:hypothetical protein [Roseivivax sediminis]SFE61676.1 hypothetical protein SAMN04515678_11256 [Roseivivax sediminis]